jgi:hypothetical protein
LLAPQAWYVILDRVEYRKKHARQWRGICSHRQFVAQRTGQRRVPIMNNDMHPTAELNPDGVHGDPTLTATLKGILDDAVELGKQQIAMLKAEIRADFRKVLAAVIPLACGIAPLLLGGLMLCFTLVHLIHWATTPTGQSLDAANVPLWGCYAIVAGAFLLVGGTLLGIGIYRFKTIPTLGGESAKALEENIQWIMNRNPK